MPRGGKRPGAGRKKGAATRKTRAVADRAATEGITPLEVMLTVMRQRFEAKDFERAASIAKDAAPYLHPRLTAIKVGGDGPGGSIPVSFIEVPSADAAGTDRRADEA